MVYYHVGPVYEPFLFHSFQISSLTFLNHQQVDDKSFKREIKKIGSAEVHSLLPVLIVSVFYDITIMQLYKCIRFKYIRQTRLLPNYDPNLMVNDEQKHSYCYGLRS